MSNLNDRQREQLKTHLVRYSGHLQQLEGDKKAQMSSYNEQIKECKKKINCITDTIISRDITRLYDAFQDSAEELFSPSENEH